MSFLTTMDAEMHAMGNMVKDISKRKPIRIYCATHCQ